jgi:hypothetical protein
MPSMLQFHHEGGTPTLAEAMTLFGLAAGELDVSFGVIATDPDAGLYTVLVADAAAPRVQAALARRPAREAEGLYGNPRIEPT